jgi:hypothetical protein
MLLTESHNRYLRVCDVTSARVLKLSYVNANALELNANVTIIQEMTVDQLEVTVLFKNVLIYLRTYSMERSPS